MERDGAARSAQRSIPEGRRGRILVVDDDGDARAALGDLLQLDGHTVETAADGFRALAKLGTFAADVILCDLRMPGLDGIDLLHRVREDDPTRAVVLMTASQSVGSAVSAMRHGATDYLTKPI